MLRRRTDPSQADRLARRLRAAIAHAFGIALAVALPASVGSAAPVAPSMPTYGWLFDDAGGTTATAFAGGQNGALLNGAAFDASTPFAYAGNTALVLDGTNDVVEMAGLANALVGWSAITISTWVRSNATNQDRAFFGAQIPGNDDLFDARYDSRGWLSGDATQQLMKFGLMVNGVNYQYESGQFVQTTAWQHVMITWESGAGMRVYVNGVLDTPTQTTFGSVAGTLSNQPRFLVGNGGKAPWQGRIDETMVWSTALGADHAAWLAANSGSLLAVPEPGAGVMMLGGLVGLLGIAVTGSRLGRR